MTPLSRTTKKRRVANCLAARMTNEPQITMEMWVSKFNQIYVNNSPAELTELNVRKKMQDILLEALDHVTHTGKVEGYAKDLLKIKREYPDKRYGKKVQK